MRGSGDTLVAEAARTLGNLLAGAQPPLVGKSEEGLAVPSSWSMAATPGSLARLNGISLYAPHVAPGTDFDSLRKLLRTALPSPRTRDGVGSFTSSRATQLTIRRPTNRRRYD